MLGENIKAAIASIRAARFRSLLTMLGIIIGVVSVVTIASLGEGVKRQLAGDVGTQGKDLITIRPGKLVDRNEEGRVTGINLLSFFATASLTEKDVETISKDEHVKSVVPMSIISGVPSYSGNRMEEGFVMATTENLPTVFAQKIEYGDFFDEGDRQRQVAVIGQGVAEKLFEENVPVSKTFQIRDKDFIVSGVLERSTTNPLTPESNFNNAIFIPYEAARSIAGSDLQIYEVLVRTKSDDPKYIDAAVGSLTNAIKNNHQQQEDFAVLRQADVVAVADNLLKSVTRTVALMAGVALVVGGIGIMNVMLVSVTERTREIGIRKAVGATNHQIQTQFLIEAIVLSVLGAIIGILLSVVINMLFRIFTSLQPVITWQSVLIAAAISAIVGIVFGLIPAIKASRKDPIEALRSH